VAVGLTWKRLVCMAALLKASSWSSLGMASTNCLICCFHFSVPTAAVNWGSSRHTGGTGASSSSFVQIDRQTQGPLKAALHGQETVHQLKWEDVKITLTKREMRKK